MAGSCSIKNLLRFGCKLFLEQHLHNNQDGGDCKKNNAIRRYFTNSYEFYRRLLYNVRKEITMGKQFTRILCVLVAGFVLSSSGCKKSDEAPPLKVGAIFAVTGGASFLG